MGKRSIFRFYSQSIQLLKFSVGWRFIEKYMFLIDKYVMINGTPGEIWAQLVTSSFEQLLMSWYIFFFQVPFLPEFVFKLWDFTVFDGRRTPKTVTEEDVEAYKFAFSRENALRGPLNYYRANLRYFVQDPPLKKPATFSRGLLLLGESEPYISRRSADLIREYFENVDFRVVPTAGHHPHTDLPEVTNKLIREFLRD